MLERLFGASSETKDMNEIPPEEMLTLARQYFFSTYSLCEADGIFDATRAMLSELSSEDAEFDQKYDAIILGTTALARAIVDWEAGNGARCYDKTLHELLDMHGIKGFTMLGNSANDQNLRALLCGIGAKIQEGTLPFKASYFKGIPFAEKHVPMLQRLSVYRPEIVAEDQVLTARESALIKKVTSQQDQITSLQKQLETAKASIKVLQPKADWHDEEQERQRVAAEEAALKKKHRFGHFGRRHG